MAGKTIRIKKSGGSTYTLEGVQSITKHLANIFTIHDTMDGPTIYDTGRYKLQYIINWKPYTDGGTTKETLADQIFNLAKETRGPMLFDWGIESESGARENIAVYIKEIKEDEVSVRPKDTLVTITLLEYEHAGGV